MLTVHHLQRGQGERIIWLCEELSIPYELKLYQRDPFFSPPELAALSPLGAAPIIADSSFPLCERPLMLAESAAIVDYIIHRHGDGRLALSPSHKDYAEYLYFFHLANSNLQPCMHRSLNLRSAQLEPDHRMRVDIDARLKKILDVYNERLKESTWLAGEEFTAADIMSVFSFTTMRLFEPVSLINYDGLLAWLQRVGERPAYRAAMEKGDPGYAPALGAKPPPRFTGMPGGHT